MTRFKQFMGNKQELEPAINAWLAESDPDITFMGQTVGGDGAVCVSFLYDESFRGQELRWEEEHHVTAHEAPVPADEFPDKPIRVPEEPGEITPRTP